MPNYKEWTKNTIINRLQLATWWTSPCGVVPCECHEKYLRLNSSHIPIFTKSYSSSILCAPLMHSTGVERSEAKKLSLYWLSDYSGTFFYFFPSFTSHFSFLKIYYNINRKFFRIFEHFIFVDFEFAGKFDQILLIKILFGTAIMVFVLNYRPKTIRGLKLACQVHF